MLVFAINFTVYFQNYLVDGSGSYLRGRTGIILKDFRITFVTFNEEKTILNTVIGLHIKPNMIRPHGRQYRRIHLTYVGSLFNHSTIAF
jgi:hypothetical protein